MAALQMEECFINFPFENYVPMGSPRISTPPEPVIWRQSSLNGKPKKLVDIGLGLIYSANQMPTNGHREVARLTQMNVESVITGY
jgi:hypothetical protein